MTLDLLEPTSLEVAIEALGALESKLDDDRAAHEVLDRLVRLAVPRIVSVAAPRVHQVWQACLRATAVGRADEAHAFRPLLGRMTSKALWSLREAHRVASAVSASSGQEVLGSGDLPGAIAELEKLKSAVLDRWETVEDLQRIVVEQYPLNNARLAELGKTRRPPQSWYEEPPADELF